MIRMFYLNYILDTNGLNNADVPLSDNKQTCTSRQQSRLERYIAL